MPVDATSIAGRTTRASDSRARADFDVTVLVPTRNERDNVAPLLRRLEKTRPELRLEVLFIDDSSDDTARVIADQARRCSRTVSLIHRPEGERSGGLGGAVRAGLLAARSDLVCVMDADLQHPPSCLIASVLAAQIAILSNFALSEWLVFRGAQTEKSLLFATRATC